ncbi:uncharacterized protein A4U43_C10F390 [Asparagus officinalis]|uniref:Fe2OG dioxygenase domain-containing protein n=2 Tax=Asparagus officinalis TaxID=4686 RepID=A0A5P1DZT0_ASPOF|nr:uncharacterized protein A4U43_C10F390 [Asparagus officinalis]
MRPRFTRPKESNPEKSPNLYVANCGPKVGISYDDMESVFAKFGEVIGVHAADETGARVIVCFSEVDSAGTAFEALNGNPCRELGGRTLHMRYSVPRPKAKVRGNDSLSVSFLSSELEIPGIYLVRDFVTAEQEQELLQAVDARPWKSLAKRRVQHYGYEFLYETRNVDSRQFLGELPSFVSPILEKISSFPHLDDNKSRLKIDQLTVNEYPPGVGLSPHIDTHSAFDEFIFSLSLAGPCIMEFRRYQHGTWRPQPSEDNGTEADKCSNIIRKAIFLPPRSMLLLSGEGRYAWHHYIPHHKIDLVGEQVVKRCKRRVSFTFRKVRRGPCCCNYRQYCDSQTET